MLRERIDNVVVVMAGFGACFNLVLVLEIEGG